jgi:flagellar motility protein MotE (MotC chaperone)
MKRHGQNNLFRQLVAAIMVSATAPGVLATENIIHPSSTDQLIFESYCSAFLKDAEKERQSRQKTELLAIQESVEKKLVEVAKKTAELDAWVSRREAILSRATLSLLKIYDAMEASAAADELSKLDDLTASAILRTLKPKKSSSILVEMDPARAASLVAVIASDAKLNNGQ